MEYDKRGNIPGPGPGSLRNEINSIPRWQSEEDEAVLNKENKVIDQLREGTLDVGNQILDTLKYGGAIKGGVKLPKVPKLPPSSHKTINITPQKANQIIDDIVINRTDRIIPKYSSGPIVQTNQGTMYRPTPGTMQSTFMSKEDPKDYSRKYFVKKFKEVGLNKGVQLDIFEMLEQPGHTENTRRSVKMGISNPEYSLRDYRKTREILVDEFLDGLEFLDIDKDSIEAHHISSLRQTAALFEGLPPEQFPQLIKMIYDEGVFTGNDPRNLMAIQKKAHLNKRKDIIAVHRYLTDELGKFGELLVGDYGSEIKDLPLEKRLPYVKNFAAVVKGSHEVANTAIRQILDERAAEKDPSALANALSQIEQEEVKRAVSEYFERQRNPNYEALLDSIMGDKSAAEALQDKGFKPKKPYQFDLFK